MKEQEKAGIGCQQRQSGNMCVGPEVPEPIALGMMKAFWENTLGTETIQIRKHILWGKKSQMPGVCMICTATCGSGAKIAIKAIRLVQ